MSIVRNLYQYRELLKTNIKKDIRGKYKGSFLGVLWSFLNPLLQVLVYYIVFPYLMRGAGMDNYIVYLVTGIVPWTFFSSAVSAGTVSMKNNEGIIKKVYFPKEILVVSQVVSGVINFFISCIIILLFCVIFGVGISIHIIAIPLVVLVQSTLTLGILFILSSVNVYIQDLEYVVTFIINMLFYGTPILYSLQQFSNAGVLLTLIKLNPMTSIMDAYRDCFLYHQWPEFLPLFFVFVFSCFVAVIGYWIFKKLEKGFAEKL